MTVLSAAVPILILLAAAVLLIAGAGSSSSVSTSGAAAVRVAREAAHMAVHITCPKTARLAGVTVGAVPGTAGLQLLVLGCDHLPSGEVLCDQACLAPVAA